MKELISGICPVNHGEIRGAKLGNVPYEEVKRVFADYEPMPLKLGGRFVRDDKKPRDLGQVKSSFDEKQYPYIVTVCTYLNGIAKGKVYDGSEDSSATLADRIFKNFIKQERSPSFPKAIEGSLREIISEFQERYHNLMPAMDALFLSGAAAGISDSFLRTKHFLTERLGRGYDFDFRPISENAFIGMHDRNSDVPPRYGEVDYEVWCSGRPFATTIINEAKMAANKIAADRDAYIKYRGKQRMKDTNMHVSQIGDRIEEFYWGEVANGSGV